MQTDEELRLSARKQTNAVRIPHLVKERFSHGTPVQC
jgi:hypothetical protein